MDTREVTFRKSHGLHSHFVYVGDELVGSTKRVEDWTVRGTSIRWEAWRKGKCVGSAKTRKDAAELLRQPLA